MAINLTTRVICELYINNNISIVKDKTINIVSFVVSILSLFFMYSNFNMNLNDNFAIDMILNVTILYSIFLFINTIIMNFYIRGLIKYINLNLPVLLHNVDVKRLDSIYSKSLEKGIEDNQLLSFLQKN